MNTATGRIREKAARLIEERGWNQHSWKGPGGELCLSAALWVACGVPDPEELKHSWPDLAKLADGEIQAELGLPQDLRWRSLADWNDKAARTQEEVLAALRGQPLFREEPT